MLAAMIGTHETPPDGASDGTESAPMLSRRNVVMAAAAAIILLVTAFTFWPRATPRRTASGTFGTLVTTSPSTAPTAPATPTRPAKPPAVRYTTRTKNVALTFDDGPDPINTPKLLDLLRRHHVKATFCLVGHRARDHKDIVRRIVAEGHTLCNHSWQHLQDLGKRRSAYLARDLEATNEQIHKAVPGAPIGYFRAPYGNFSPRLNGFAAAQGMSPIAWNVDDGGVDTAEYGTGTRMVQHIVATVKRQIRQGSIVLSHDNGKPFTITAYRVLLPWLKAHYTLIALPTTPPAVS
jgi:peptidoglycan/xylan/chitin deacetylase (PgdA/CDA1 family)